MTTEWQRRGVGRRTFLQAGGGLAALLAACAPAAAPAPAPVEPPAPPSGSGQEAWQRQFETWLAAARQEGKVVVNFTGAGSAYRKVGEAFEKAYPGITFEFTAYIPSSLLWNRFHPEREAGIYTWDLISMPLENGLPNLLEKGHNVDPIRPILLHPDVLNNKAWRGGFEAGFLDKAKQWSFGFLFNEQHQLFKNTDLVKEGDLKSVKDLMDPRWKGKMVFSSAESGAQLWLGTVLRENLGDDFVKKLYTEQEVTFLRDARQLTEGMVRGKYAIGIGVNIALLAELGGQGIGQNVVPLKLPESTFAAISSPLWLIKPAPHPNAARIFANWFLSPDGQRAFAEATKTNSRRLDVPPGDPNTVAPPDKEYKIVMGYEERIAINNATPPWLKALGVPP